MAVKIRSWVNYPRELDLDHLFTNFKKVSKGWKVAWVDDDKIEPYGCAVVLYVGKGTKKEIHDAFMKAHEVLE